MQIALALVRFWGRNERFCSLLVVTKWLPFYIGTRAALSPQPRSVHFISDEHVLKSEILTIHVLSVEFDLTCVWVFQVAVNIVHAGVGPVSQSDVALAEACGACVVGFNVRAMAGAVDAAAKRAKIKVCQHRIIYHLLEDIGKMIVGMAPGTKETRVAGQAEILSVFEIKGRGRECRGATKIAGCKVVEGKLTRDSRIRVMRSGEVLFEGPCASLRREKDDVETAIKGTECGIVLKDWIDFQVGDVIQCIEDVRRMPKFVSSQSGAVRIEC